MKKSLVLAMAMALGVTASAYAANPFSDVPAGHWAYDAVNKLAAEGVVDGYPDGTYGGDKLMTRYEMAQIVAKAMAKGANVDKLAAEFADELDSLGVRVANLEKKADNVKITGQIRASYKDVSGDKKDNNMRLRSRLFVNGTINDDWTYTGRFHNEQYVTGNDDKGAKGEDDLDFNWAFVSGRVGGVKMDAGRMDFTYADVVDVRGDGVKLAYGDDVKVTGWVFKGNSDIEMLSDDRVYVAGVETSFGAVDTAVRYYRADTEFDNEIVEVALAGEIAKDLTLRGTWFNGTTDDKAERLAGTDVDTNGWLVGLSYGGAKASEPGSWGVYANYSDRPFATYLLPTNLSGYADAPYALLNESSVDGAAKADGYEGYEIGANVTLAKNIVAAVKYFDLEEREGSKDAQTLWSEVVFTF
jgi:hypothetical protein